MWNVSQRQRVYGEMCFGGFSSQCGQMIGMPMWLPYLRAVYKFCEPGGKQPRRKVELNRHALAKSLESAEGKGEGGFGDTICSKVGFFTAVSVGAVGGAGEVGLLGAAFKGGSSVSSWVGLGESRVYFVSRSTMDTEAALVDGDKVTVRALEALAVATPLVLSYV